MENFMKIQTITFTIIASGFACFAVVSKTHVLTPLADGCYPGYTTAEGCNALKPLTSGLANTGVGWYSLFADSTGAFNTGVDGCEPGCDCERAGCPDPESERAVTIEYSRTANAP